MSKGAYTRQYYESISEGSLRSAHELIPIFNKFFQPRSVIDVGCGTGNWLHVWEKCGVTNILGLDGDYIRKESLLIKPEQFQVANLETALPINKQFDLVMSLEVAEHIRPENASVFIHSLCLLGDIILFSAAIPGQGGHNHVNEQYPDYWIALFEKENFSAYDFIRHQIWNNKNIDTCYRQNLLLFLKDDKKNNYPGIQAFEGPVLALVHPEHFDQKERKLKSINKVLRTPFHAGWHFLKKLAGIFQSKKEYEP